MNDLHTNIIKVSGKNIANFFQNIITNDIFKLTSHNALYSSILTPQGKYLIDFFIVKEKDNYILECNHNQTENLIKHPRSPGECNKTKDDFLEFVRLFFSCFFLSCWTSRGVGCRSFR